MTISVGPPKEQLGRIQMDAMMQQGQARLHTCGFSGHTRS